MSIENIILDRDRRGISALRPHLPDDFCGQAATLVLDNPGTTVIVTGFYILAAGKVETDGPPGAIVIGNALGSLGYEVVYVTDQHAGPLLKAIVGSVARVVEFEVTDDEASKELASELRAQLDPSVLISIERCGLTNEGLYRNMHGQDITRFTARLDHLFTDHPHTVGIGDGGNEIGMGNLASVIETVPSLVKTPCITASTKLIISSVSNWGGYGLVAALSEKKGKNLLPSVEEEQELVRQTVSAGAVDGMSGQHEYKVDGFSLEQNSLALVQLHELLAQQGILP